MMRAIKLSCCGRKGRLLACCEPPAVADEHAVEEEEHMRAVSTSLSVPWLTSPPGIASTATSGSSMTYGQGKLRHGDGGDKRKRFSPRMLAKIIRSAVFATSMRSHSGDSLPYKKRLARSRPDSSGERALGEGAPISYTSSSCSTSFSSSASSGLLSSTSSSESTLEQTGMGPQRKTQLSCRQGVSTIGRAGDSAWMRLCLVVLFLLFVLVFWGRMCAIFWTSACLCLVPGRVGSAGAVGRKGSLPVLSSVACGTRVDRQSGRAGGSCFCQ